MLNIIESSKTKMLLEDIFQLDKAHLIGPTWEDNVGVTYMYKWPFVGTTCWYGAMLRQRSYIYLCDR